MIEILLRVCFCASNVQLKTFSIEVSLCAGVGRWDMVPVLILMNGEVLLEGMHGIVVGFHDVV